MHLPVRKASMATMTDDKVKRRLTTVLCADVYGYSRLMEVDEAGTLATLRRYRTAMAGLVERHDGRIVNTWGDAVIAEFEIGRASCRGRVAHTVGASRGRER